MNLIFMDLDGTLEDSRLDMIESVNSVRVYFDLNPLPPTQIEINVTKGMEHLYRACFPEMFSGGPRNDSRPDATVLAEIQYVYEADYKKHVAHHTRAYEGIPEALAELEELGTLALYTNKPAHISRKLLLELKLARYFRFIIGCDTFPETKPSPVPMQNVARDTEFNPETDKAFMIGDSKGDMEAAAAFGARAVWCAWGYYKKAPSEPAPHFTAQRPSDLPGLIRDNS